jgi:hypothetical protein
MQDKPSVPAKSINQLLALFMRQAALESATKRPELPRMTPAGRSKT